MLKCTHVKKNAEKMLDRKNKTHDFERNRFDRKFYAIASESQHTKLLTWLLA